MTSTTGIVGIDRLADKVDVTSTEITASVAEEDFWFAFTHGEETYQSSSSDVSDFFQMAKVLKQDYYIALHVGHETPQQQSDRMEEQYQECLLRKACDLPQVCGNW